MSKTAKYQSFKIREWNKNKYCKYCGVEMISPLVRLSKGETMPFNFCTLNHVISRYKQHDRIINGGKWEICCHACNHHIETLETNKLPIELLRKKANNGHRKIA